MPAAHNHSASISKGESKTFCVSHLTVRWEPEVARRGCMFLSHVLRLLSPCGPCQRSQGLLAVLREKGEWWMISLLYCIYTISMFDCLYLIIK